MTGPFVPVLVFGIELVVEVDQVVIEIVVEVVIIVIVLVVFIVQIIFLVQLIFIIVEVIFIIEEVVVIIIIVVEIVVLNDLVLGIVTVDWTSRIVAIVYRVPLPRVAIFRDFLNRRLELVQHTITFLRVREAHAHVSLRATASFDHSR